MGGCGQPARAAASIASSSHAGSYTLACCVSKTLANAALPFALAGTAPSGATQNDEPALLVKMPPRSAALLRTSAMRAWCSAYVARGAEPGAPWPAPAAPAFGQPWLVAAAPIAPYSDVSSEQSLEAGPRPSIAVSSGTGST
jgi:hypothetical protein